MRLSEASDGQGKSIKRAMRVSFEGPSEGLEEPKAQTAAKMKLTVVGPPVGRGMQESANPHFYGKIHKISLRFVV